MSYQVLARKWRPQTFVDVVGQEHVLTALANGLSLGRIHHAYLFSGTRGVGKTTIARLLAKGLNCETGITAIVCGRCASCLEIEQGRFVDLIEIDAASRTKVEDTRELLDNVQYLPARGRFKVYLIDEVHMLSRHSFNALLKTLEEPPSHVKFLLATTDPQKLPVTILSRCLQFHLKALDVEQIRTQLENVLNAEHISSDFRALQLLARAADGSVRDALSLADQAIALGHGQVTTAAVTQMLGTLDDEQPLAIIEALVSADGAKVMALVEQVAERGGDWENLLIEILALLHRIAMVQLLPSILDNHYAAIELRLRELARTLPPADIQLYYQTLLVGRKELVYAPDKRMGVEMSLLRALAFHPKVLLSEPQSGLSEGAQLVCNDFQSADFIATNLAGETLGPVNDDPNVVVPCDTALPDTTVQLLQARTQLLKQKVSASSKKAVPTAQPDSTRALPRVAMLERSASITEHSKQIPVDKVAEKINKINATEEENDKKEAYRWRAQHQPIATEQVATPRALRSALQHEKTPELSVKLSEEAIKRDAWAAEIAQLSIPKLVQQLALNAFKRQTEDGNVCLHLRSGQRHLNSLSARKMLADALSELYGNAIRLSVIEDDESAEKTPLEWRQTIYEEKLIQARQSVIADNNVQTLLRFFDADLDEESIQPI